MSGGTDDVLPTVVGDQDHEPAMRTKSGGLTRSATTTSSLSRVIIAYNRLGERVARPCRPRSGSARAGALALARAERAGPREEPTSAVFTR
jgi:hypothetical protein